MISFSWTLTVTPAPATTVQPTATQAAGAAAARDFALGPDDDLLLVEGDLVMLTGAEGVASDIRARLQTLTGDYFRDTSLGLPREQILGVKFNKGRSEELYRTAVRETPGVATVESLVASFADRTLDVRLRVTTDFGDVIEAAFQGAL